MKKLIAMLLAMVMVLGLVACGGNAAPAATEAPKADAPAAPAATEAPKAEEPAGSVYYLNFKPEADASWQKFAADYTAKTGVEVKVVTAASGTYGDTLTAEMGKSEAPTLFQVANPMALADWDEYALDLANAEFLKALASSDFVMYNEAGEAKAVAYCTETFGIITNVTLLAKAGYKVEDIKDFESLKKIAEDIHARAAELGFDAFSNPGLDGSSSWRFSGHLTNMPLYYEFRDNNVAGQPATVTGAYMDNFRNIWDLYVNTSAADPATLSTSTGDESTAQFKESKAVFYQNGTWEYSGLIDAGLTDADLAMIPIYCGVEGEENSGLCTGSENFWCVNSKASEEDIKATLDFLNYVVTSEEGLAMMMKEFGAIPFKNAPASTNKFVADGANLVNAGKYPVTWAFTTTPNVDNWRAGIVSALAAYSADQTDDNWKAVVDAFVVGWEIEYAAQNG